MISKALNDWYQTKGLLETAERAGRYGGHKIGPSNLADCMRKHAFLLMGEKPEPTSPESLRTFELGHQRGERLEQACKEIWPDAQSQVPITIPLGKFKLEGTCDLWIPSLRTIVDFKTAGGFKMGLLSSGKEGAGEDYEMQLQAYRHGVADALGWTTARREIRCLLVFEAKDSDARNGVRAGQLIEVDVPHTEELEKRYQARLMAIEGLMIRKEQGNLDPLEVKGLDRKHWKCKTDGNGKPMYCAIGPIRGRCHE